MTEFSGLDLAQPILRAIEAQGYTTPTPIQAQAIPSLLEGRDILGIAQTGTGKTAAFALPILNRIAKETPRLVRKSAFALVLAPTRELAVQIGESLRDYGRGLRMRQAIVFGGSSMGAQIRAMSQGVDVLVATPGRLLDLMRQGHIKLDQVKFFVLDEADRMLDMGFINDVQKIVSELPSERQTAFFSATMPKTVQGLADTLLNDPVRVEVAQQATTAERVDQTVLFVHKDKKQALLSQLLEDTGIQRVLIFTRTKHGADRVARNLDRAGVQSDAIHGNKTQSARQRALKDFKSGRIRALVATDIAARGIDVDGITHVINFELPNEPDSYVHRIGRTARAGADGKAISFCDAEEKAYLRDIERTIRQSVPVHEDHPFHSTEIANDPGHAPRKSRKPNFRGGFKGAPKAASGGPKGNGGAPRGGAGGAPSGKPGGGNRPRRFGGKPGAGRSHAA